MPNTLAHLGAQTLATRALIRRADVKWIFAGAVIPDLPWILGRATRTLVPALHGHDLWAYLIAQSSLAVSLLLCTALALLATAPGRVFAILALNATAHLILDALQLKWGNGAHLFAPVSWTHWNAGWFGVESWPTYALTALGLGVAIWVLRDSEAWDLRVPSGPLRLAAVAGFIALYLSVPIALRHGPMNADTNSVGTFADGGNRTGRTVQFDRVPYRAGDDRDYLCTYAGECLPLTSRPLDRTATVSARATFVDDSTLAVHELHDHSGWPRDVMNYIGLALVAVTWAVPLFRRPPAAASTSKTAPSDLSR